MKDKKNGDVPFDEAMKQLETILDQLERGDLPLEKTIEIFESGMDLVRTLGEKLDSMETRIRKLVEKDGGELELEPFESESENED